MRVGLTHRIHQHNAQVRYHLKVIKMPDKLVNQSHIYIVLKHGPIQTSTVIHIYRARYKILCTSHYLNGHFNNATYVSPDADNRTNA